VDPSKFLDELTKAVGVDREEYERKAATSAYFSDSEDESSSSDGNDEEQEQEASKKRPSRLTFECVSGSDSDDSEDDDDESFANAYDQVLQEELEGTKARQTQNSNSTSSKVVVEIEEEEGEGEEGPSKLDQARGVAEDVSVIENMLSSVQLQQGLPGPASNLMGMLGIEVPQEAWRAKEKDRDQNHA
jgi:hypothetical protein